MHRTGNKVVVGSTRSGKSVGEWQDVVNAADAGDVAIVVMDPHEKSLAWNCFQQLIARGHEHRIVYDQLHHSLHVPGYRFLRQSTARNPLQKQIENEETAKGFTNILCRRGGVDISKQPQKEEWVLKATSFVIEQKTERSAADLSVAFKPHHPKFKSLLKGCTNPELVHNFSEIAEGTIKRGTYHSANRLIEGTCSTISFQSRCGTNFDVEAFIDDAGILLVEGGIETSIMAAIMGAIQIKVINHIRRRRTNEPRVLLVLDEANNVNLVSEIETRAMAECQKMGLDIHCLVQLLDFPSAAVANGVFSNCVRHEWYYNANAGVISKAMDDLGFGRGEAEGTESIRSLEVGERWIKHRSATAEHVSRERVQMLQNPWGFGRLAAIKTNQALSRVRKRPEYQHLGQRSITAVANAPSRDASEVETPLDRLRSRQKRTNDD